MRPVDLAHTLFMDPFPQEAVVAGSAGVFVGQYGAGALWEVRVSPARLAQILAQCGQGRALQVTAAGSSYKALARRWWVLPDGDELVVRIALEKCAAA